MGRPREFDVSEILRRATALFGAKGFDALSIDALLTDLGMNRASFYKLYGSKHGLARAALQQVCERAESGDIDNPSRDFTAVALVELAGLNEEFQALITQAYQLCFAADPARLGQHLIARAQLDLASSQNNHTNHN